MSAQTSFDFVPPSTVKDCLSSPVARRLDPGTSHLAGETFTESGRREGHMLVILAVLKLRGRPLTIGEIARESKSLDYIQVGRRMKQMEKGGLVLRRNSRKCTVNGTEMQCWEAV